MPTGRLSLILLAATLMLCACGVAAPATAPTTATNKLAAQRDVAKRFELAVLPRGATRLTAEPAGDGGLLVRPYSEPGTTNVVDHHGFWRVPEPLSSVVEFVRTHRPTASRLVGTGNAGGFGVPENEELTFLFPEIRGQIATRWLSFVVVALKDGSTGVRVDAQDVWIVPRSPNEKVPAGVRQISIRSGYPGQAAIVSLKVTDPAQVSRIVRWIDALGIVQPGAVACPGLGGPTVTFDFRAAASGLLARARVIDSQGTSGPCNPINFTVRGYRQAPLVAQSFLKQVQHLLKIDFAGGAARPFTGPAGGPVPFGTKATSVTFVSPRTAFVLGTAPCRHRECSVLLRTRNRGRSWVGLPPPLEAVSEFLGHGLWGLRFADSRHGYAYGNGFWETANGGASWRQGGGPARLVLALEPVQDRVLVAVAAGCLPGQGGCPRQVTLYRRPVSSGRWTQLASTRTYSSLASIAVHGAGVWALMGNRVYVSTNGGRTVAPRPSPCPAYGADSIAADSGHTYLLCYGSGGAGSVAKYVYRTVAARLSWELVGRPPMGGGPQGISAGGDSAVLVAAASGASELYRSSDGGRSWRTVLTENDGGAGWADLGFTTITDGVVVHGPAIGDEANDGRPGQLLLSDDGGRTWHPVSF